MTHNTTETCLQISCFAFHRIKSHTQVLTEVRKKKRWLNCPFMSNVLSYALRIIVVTGVPGTFGILDVGLTWAVGLRATPLAVQLTTAGGITNQTSVIWAPVVDSGTEDEFFSDYNRTRRGSRVAAVNLCRTKHENTTISYWGCLSCQQVLC